MTPGRITAKRLAWALAISASLHLVLTLGPFIQVPEYHPATTLEATLVEPPPPPPPAQKRAVPNRATRSGKRHGVKTPPPPVVPSPSAPVAAPPPATEEAPEERDTTTPQSEPEQAPILLPEQAKIDYILYKGRDGFVVGKAEHTWKREGRRYTITQVTEASGIVSLFYSGRHVQISQGEIASTGLQPTSYWVQRGQSADKTDTAQFDWENGKLVIGTGDNTRRVDLPQGAQDLLSFPYQLAFAAPQVGSAQLYLTNGRNLEKYGYQELGEEILETPMGQLKALHIGKLRRDGEENTEIWLAPEYHYLPVKIRHTDKQGGIIEQTAAAIKEE